MIYRIYYVDIVRYWLNFYIFGLGWEMESMCIRWKECVYNYLNVFVWEFFSYILDFL